MDQRRECIVCHALYSDSHVTLLTTREKQRSLWAQYIAVSDVHEDDLQELFAEELPKKFQKLKVEPVLSFQQVHLHLPLPTAHFQAERRGPARAHSHRSASDSAGTIHLSIHSFSQHILAASAATSRQHGAATAVGPAAASWKQFVFYLFSLENYNTI